MASVFIQYNRINPNTGNEYSVGELLTVVSSMTTGMMLVFGMTPNIQALVKARVIGRVIFDVIDRVPEIRDNTNSDIVIDSFKVCESIRF